MENFKNVADFLFETGMLAKTPRSGFHFLGSGEQSVAEHINRTVFVGYALAMLDGSVDVGKVMKMCLVHDLAEARVSDLNYVHQKYVERFEEKAMEDLAKKIPFGDDMKSAFAEYEKKESKESLYAKDADQIEFLLSLKEEMDIGNERAKEWIPALKERLKTDFGKSLAEAILETDSSEWWFGDKKDDWWVNRIKK
jgi:putative hydrolase of HD superfamily